jgi:hypothetical protein
MSAFEIFGVFIALAMSGVFAWEGLKGVRTGTARVPVQFFGEDEYHRGDALFGLVLIFDFAGAFAAMALAFGIWSGRL